jgi:hypothetical protein
MTTTTDRGWLSKLKTIGLILAVPISLITIWDWVTKPSMGLSSVVTYGPFKYPPNLRPILYRIDSLISDSVIRAALDSTQLLRTREERLFGVRDVVRDVRQRVASAIPSHSRTENFGPRGYWDVQIENTGTQAVRDVRLSLPDAAYSCVYREAESPACSDVPPIRIGDLQPRELIRVTSWTSFEPSAYDGRKIRLTHEEGIGDVVVRGPAGPFFRGLEEFWGVFWRVFLFAAGAIALVLLVGFLTGHVRIQRAPQDNGQSGQA